MSTTTINAATIQTASVITSASNRVTGPINLTNGLAPGQLQVLCNTLGGGIGSGASFFIEYTKDNINWTVCPMQTSPGFTGIPPGNASLELSLFSPYKNQYPLITSEFIKRPLLPDGEIGLLAAAGAVAIRARSIDAASLALTFGYYTIT